MIKFQLDSVAPRPVVGPGFLVFPGKDTPPGKAILLIRRLGRDLKRQELPLRGSPVWFIAMFT